ncbi:MAG: hypothetical protein PW845_19740 [Pseudomonas sp.]|uniref:hypothetical protein n=1 Tax=Pseudomonas abieticivorans TaxID=2931382 RepID=UPI0020BF3E4D|nr:hypothetical protein [Pseudomonas sp. PIA16]MDE1167539.1 hypothetical protein [Pseudomonas sp.]
MNRQSVATASISSQHVQQGLFLLFAVLITLLCGQQYQRWSDSHEAAQIQHRTLIGSTFHSTGAKVAGLATVSRPTLERADTVGEMPAQQRWVF